MARSPRSGDPGASGDLAAPLHAPAGAADTRRMGARSRVLLVDDDAAIRRSLSRVLGDVYEVVAAPDGKAALAALAADARFDLILCDAGMAGMSGLDVYRAVRDRA